MARIMAHLAPFRGKRTDDFSRLPDLGGDEGASFGGRGSYVHLLLRLRWTRRSFHRRSGRRAVGVHAPAPILGKAGRGSCSRVVMESLDGGSVAGSHEPSTVASPRKIK